MNNQSLFVVKNNHLGREVWRYPGSILKMSPKGVLLEAKFNAMDHAYGFKKGDIFLEVYLRGKWFNIYEIHDRETNVLKSWYCNVTRPFHMDGQELYYDDLALDILVYPDGYIQILDKEEFENLMISEKDRKTALDGLEKLQALFQKNFPLDVKTLV